jgi:two-component system sensor histidine kinase HydH
MKRDSAQIGGVQAGANVEPAISIGGRALRWPGAVLGLLAAIADTASLRWMGATFAINGRDVSALVAAWFGLSFAALGYLLGDAIDGHRRQNRALELIRAQVQTIKDSRAKLVQSEKLAALGQLAAAIAHEVRNPLTVIRSAAQTLRESLPGDSPDAARACSFITDETDRLGNLISALLAFARPVQISPAEVTIAELFERAVSVTAPEISAKHIRVNRHAGAELGAVRVDPDLMGQVFVGLVANAVAAVEPGGEVSLDAKSNGANVELAVADSGPGVPPELRRRVFEPFFTTRAEGVGLGLAIARQIVEAHGGVIDVDSSASGGARFWVRLPIAGRAPSAAV